MKARATRSHLAAAGTVPVWCAVAIAAFGWSASPAQAQRNCAGTIDTTLLQPLPPQLVITPESDMQDAPNPTLAKEFLSGLRGAGTQLGSQGNATMSFSVEVDPSNSASNVTAGTYSDFSWVSGESLSSGEQSGLRGASLTVSVQLIDSSSAAMLWLLTMKCTIETNDSAALARELGSTIGEALGKSLEHRTL